MTMQNFTEKSQMAVQQSIGIAENLGHQSLENGHLLKGIMEVDETVLPYFLQKAQASKERLTLPLDAQIKRYPKVEGGGQVFVGNSLSKPLKMPKPTCSRTWRTWPSLTRATTRKRNSTKG